MLNSWRVLSTRCVGSSRLRCFRSLQTETTQVYHSLYSIANALAIVSNDKTGNKSGDLITNCEEILAARDSFLYKAVWKDISVEGESEEAAYSKVHIYKATSTLGLNRICINEFDAIRWVSKLGFDFAALVPHLNKSEQHNWKTIDRVLLTPKDLRRLLKDSDYHYRNRLKVEAEFKALNSKDSSIARFVAVDVQASDVSTKRLTEIGICVFDRLNNNLESMHFVIGENEELTNRFVAKSERNKSIVGKAVEVVGTTDALQYLSQLLKPVKCVKSPHWAGRPIRSPDDDQIEMYQSALVTTSMSNTLKLLTGASLDRKGGRLTQEAFETLPKYDIQRIYNLTIEKDVSSPKKLREICKELAIPTQSFPVNAESNAYWIASVFQTLLRGELFAPISSADAVSKSSNDSAQHMAGSIVTNSSTKTKANNSRSSDKRPNKKSSKADAPRAVKDINQGSQRSSYNDVNSESVITSGDGKEGIVYFDRKDRVKLFRK